jgi:hypothetical protein
MDGVRLGGRCGSGIKDLIEGFKVAEDRRVQGVGFRL